MALVGLHIPAGHGYTTSSFILVQFEKLSKLLGAHYAHKPLIIRYVFDLKDNPEASGLWVALKKPKGEFEFFKKTIRPSEEIKKRIVAGLFGSKNIRFKGF